MLQQQGRRSARPASSRLTVSLAKSRADVREAQRLRYAVFGDELGARLHGPEPGVDEDRFDAHAHHLLVRDEASGEVVGTYRILDPEGARAAGGLYSAGEFDLDRLAHLAPRLVEVGRSCIHPDYRRGAAISLLWSGIGAFVRAGGYEYLAGCASMGMADGGQLARAVYRSIGARHLAPRDYRVFPRCPLPPHPLPLRAEPLIPPLVKGYLRVGAYVCGEPAWDPRFNTADLFVLLPMARADPRYLRHYSPRGESEALASA
jgi:putative hemolysin